MACRNHLLLILFTLLTVACKSPVGVNCQIDGSGFTSVDPCQTQCLARWTVICPDGGAIHPAVCAGEKSCTTGGCPDGQICYHFDDPFEERSYCIPETVCPDSPTTEKGKRVWERAAEQRAIEARKGVTRDTPRLKTEIKTE